MSTLAKSSTHSNLEIIKPRFFPGQYLNDDDLQSIVNWAEKRIELQPMSNTWGIVCGLHLSPAVDARKNEPHLSISSGYGFDACQRLCVVDTSTNVPLPTGPCASCDSSTDNIHFGPYKDVPRNQLAVFDYYLEPSDIDARKSIGASKDGARNCSVVRYKVGAKVSWKRVYFPLEESTSGTLSQKKSPELKLLDELQSFPWWKDDAPTIENNRSQISNWLASKTKECPDLLRNWPMMIQEKLGGSSFQLIDLVELLSWMCFSLRMSPEPCPVVDDCAVIPIARVWLRTQGNKRQVAWIDDRYPYRKFTTCDSRGFELRRWIGRNFDETSQSAALSQVILEKKEWEFPKTLEDLKKIFSEEPQSSEPKSSMTALYRKLWNDGSTSDKGSSETIIAFAPPTSQTAGQTTAELGTTAQGTTNQVSADENATEQPPESPQSGPAQSDKTNSGAVEGNDTEHSQQEQQSSHPVFEELASEARSNKEARANKPVQNPSKKRNGRKV